LNDASSFGEASLRDRTRGSIAANERFARFLAKLHPDLERAGVAYEDLRRRLIIFFRLRREQAAEDLADEVLDRVARRISEGEEIQKVEFYIVGVARFVLRERLAAAQREGRTHQEIAYLQRSSGTWSDGQPAADANLSALRICLEGLKEADRSMILTYYAADGPKRMRVRQNLAQQLQVSLNALHNRALRLRKQLERCVSNRVEERTEAK